MTTERTRNRRTARARIHHLAIGALALLLPTLSIAGGIGVLPVFVLKDATGEPVGPVVSVSPTDWGGHQLLVAIEVPDNGDRVLLTVEDPSVMYLHMGSDIMFANPGCTGQAVIGASRYGIESFRNGTNYATAKNADGDMILYRGDGTAAITIAIQSTEHKTGYGCSGHVGSGTGTPALPVLNLTDTFPPPYSLE